MGFSVFFGLIFCNLLWSATYSVGKFLIAAGFRPLEVSFLRYAFALIPLLAYCLRGGRESLLAEWWKKKSRLDLRILIVGVLTFYLSPLCQMTGLNMSRAIDSSVMVAMEPLFTVLAAVVILRERIRLPQVVALAIALLGVGALTELTWAKLSSFSDARLIGNLVFILSLVSEAGYSIASKPALDRRDPVLFITLSLCTGLVLLFAHNLVLDGPSRLAGLAPLFQSAGVWSWAAILYLGLGCTSFAYLFWMIVLKDTPISAMVLTLYIQPVTGLLLGHLWLGESITSSTLLGMVLIFVAVWLGSRPARASSVAREVVAPQG